MNCGTHCVLNTDKNRRRTEAAIGISHRELKIGKQCVSVFIFTSISFVVHIRVGLTNKNNVRVLRCSDLCIFPLRYPEVLERVCS